MEGFQQTCREGMTERVERSRPGANNWQYGPPVVVGVIPHGNNKSEIRWTVEDRPRPPGKDQYDYLSIHAVACDHEKFDGEGDPTAICVGCAKMKQRLEERFDSNKDLHNNTFNSNTRKDLLKRTGSLQDKNTQHHRRENQNARKRLAYREKQFKVLVEQVGVDVKLNKASDAIFDDETNISAVEEFLKSKLTQDSMPSSLCSSFSDTYSSSYSSSSLPTSLPSLRLVVAIPR